MSPDSTKQCALPVGHTCVVFIGRSALTGTTDTTSPKGGSHDLTWRTNTHVL